MHPPNILTCWSLSVGLGVMCVCGWVWLRARSDLTSQRFLRDHRLCRPMLVFPKAVTPGYGWVVGLDDGNIVIGQEDDTFYNEDAREDRQVGPHFHHEGVTGMWPYVARMQRPSALIQKCNVDKNATD